MKMMNEEDLHEAKKQVLCLLLGTALLVSALAACGSNSTKYSGSQTVSQPQTEIQENESEPSQTAQEAVPGESIVTNGGEVISLTSLEHRDETSDTVVYYTSDISAQAMLDIYEALGVELVGDNIAVKLSTGEPPASNNLDPN